MSKPYNKEEYEDVREKKTREYGKGEYFAVPSLRSYPLTKNGKPSKERTLAAWRYINMPRNAGKLGEHAEAAKKRIRSFARKHFGMELEEGEKEVKKSFDEIYLLPEYGLWPVTKGLKADPALCNAAWQVMHTTKASVLLGDAVDIAEQRLLKFAEKHNIKLADGPMLMPM